MSRPAFFSVAVFASAIMASPAFAETKSYALADFTRISASAGVDVEVAAGADYSVVATSSGEGIQRLEIKVVEGELRIGRKPLKGFRWRRGDDVSVKVSLPALEALDVSSGASVRAASVDAGAFAMDVSSGGSVSISGRCDALTVDVSSGGDIEAREFECRTANASASSGGSADIYASVSVNGDASSGGSIDVSGSPKTVNKDTSSGGSVDVE
jgi:hypothetical protein